jgi:hypothetical protein
MFVTFSLVLGIVAAGGIALTLLAIALDRVDV